MALFLDGNNILGELVKGPGQKHSRERLLEVLLASGLPSKCTVVFDGPPPSMIPRDGRRGKVRVLYSGRRTADSLILSLLRRGDQVVTADRDLSLRSRDLGARVLLPRAFLSSVGDKRANSSAEKPTPTAVDVADWMTYFGLGDDGE